MKLPITLLLLFISFSLLNSQKKDYPIQPVSFTQVQMNEGFWHDRMEINRTVTIPYAIKLCEETGRIKNFAIAAGKDTGRQSGRYPFDDSDVYKVIEGASYTLMLKSDPVLESKLDTIISYIRGAQEKDGYLYTARTNNSERLKNAIGPERWSNLQWSHELYNLGHLYEGAVAHYQATGKRTLLDVAIKSADLIVNTFGPDKLQIPPGHEIIETGLVKLYRITGNEKYLNLAKFFIDIRGKGEQLNGRKSWGEYAQDHLPTVDQEDAVGHAVRAVYLYAGVADVAALTGEESYRKMLNNVWDNVVSKKIYLTGGIGATGSGEAFGGNYELPNASAYNETCASIGNIFWNFRMFLLNGESKYIDVLERTLYNAALSGISMSGDKFFYPNPLESFGTHERAPWFECACCPSNVTRFVSSIPNYIYAVKDDEVYINLFTNNSADINLKSGKLNFIQKTNYPWSGDIKILIEPNNIINNISIKIRIPGWAQNKPVPSDLYKYADEDNSGYSIMVNGKGESFKVENGYAVISRKWEKDDLVELNFPMPVRRIEANQNVEADRGRIALQKGPIVFCAEWNDNPNGFVHNILLPDLNEIHSEYKPNVLNGIEELKGKAFGYRFINENSNFEKREQDFVAIPYYAWAHRGKGEMSVWFANNEKNVRPLYGPSLLSGAVITASHGKNPNVVKDQFEPKNSADESFPFFHWWPNKGESEWVQIDFDELKEISQVSIFWFDDTGTGECRVPQSWKVFYKFDDRWQSVYTIDKYGIEKDKYNSVDFETVRTNSLKIEIQSQPEFAGGIHEIKIK